MVRKQIGGAHGQIPFAYGGIYLGDTLCPEKITFNKETNEWTIKINDTDINLGTGGNIDGSNELRLLLVYLIKNNAADPYLQVLDAVTRERDIPSYKIAPLVRAINKYIIGVISGHVSLVNGRDVHEHITTENLKAGITELIQKSTGVMGGGKRKKKSIKGKSKKRKSKTKKRCKKCRCQPCLCKKQIHCYQITCKSKRKSKKKKSKNRSKLRKKSH